MSDIFKREIEKRERLASVIQWLDSTICLKTVNNNYILHFPCITVYPVNSIMQPSYSYCHFNMSGVCILLRETPEG